jgi:hypothetical protein
MIRVYFPVIRVGEEGGGRLASHSTEGVVIYFFPSYLRIPTNVSALTPFYWGSISWPEKCQLFPTSTAA